MPQSAQARSSGQTEHEHGARFFPRSEERRRGQHVPDQSGEETPLVVKSMHGSGYPEFRSEVRLPDLQILMRGAHHRDTAQSLGVCSMGFVIHAE